MILPEKGTTRFNYQELLHPDLYGSLPSASRPELPVLEPIKTASIAPIRLVPFHEAYAHKDYGCVVHFFIRDHHFLCVLRHPDRYLDFFRKCHAVIAPDLSKYLWYRGYEEAVSTLHPSLIIRYGTRMPREHSDISLYFVNERLMRLRHGS